MSSRINGVNRTVGGLLGLLLVAAGASGLAVSFGLLGDGGAPVLPQGMRDFAQQQPWFWWALAAGCLLLAVLGLLWLLAQLRTDRVSRMDLTTDGREGLTTVHTRALANAVEAEVGKLRGVGGASATVIDRKGRRLGLTVDLTEYADIGEIRRSVEERVVVNARQAVDDPDLPIDIELRPGKARSGSRAVR